jgi:hypothetical protein
LYAIIGQQSQKGSIQQRRNEAPPSSSEPPNRLQQSWNWYKQHQPRKKKKPFRKFGCGIKLGCLLLIGAFFACIIINALLSGNSSSLTTPIPKQDTKLTLNQPDSSYALLTIPPIS